MGKWDYLQNKMPGGSSAMPGGEAWGRGGAGGAEDLEGQEDGWRLLAGSGRIRGDVEKAGNWRESGEKEVSFKSYMQGCCRQAAPGCPWSIWLQW